MKLVERISQQNNATPVPFQRSLMSNSSAKRTVKDVQAEGFQQLKLAVHNRLFEMLDVTRLESLEPTLAAQKVTEAISAILDDEGRLLTDTDKQHLIEEIKNELLGLGPLEPLLWDDEITDILVNGHNQVYVEKRGKLHATEVKFQDDQHLMLIIDRIVSQVGRRVDEASPMVDARLPDGSRINAIIPPLALDGPSLSIRRFGRKRYNIDDLVDKKTIVPEIVEFLRTIVRARLNILICGGTGSGKTTMLNCMSLFVPADERIVTIEDSAELMLQQPHVVRLETRPANVEGKGEVSQRDLVKNTLRMRPDRIIVGEVRGGEVFDMLQAMSTGHDGSIATIHANTPARQHGAPRDDDAVVGRTDSAARDAPADRVGAQYHRSRVAPLRRFAQSHAYFRDQRNGGRDGDDAGLVRIQAHRHRTGRRGAGRVCGHRNPFNLLAAARSSGIQTRRQNFPQHHRIDTYGLFNGKRHIRDRLHGRADLHQQPGE